MTLQAIWWAFAAGEGRAHRWTQHVEARLAPVLAFYGARDVGSMTAVDVVRYRRWRADDGTAAAQIGSEVAALVYVLRWAVAAQAFAGEHGRRRSAVATIIASTARVRLMAAELAAADASNPTFGALWERYAEDVGPGVPHFGDVARKARPLITHFGDLAAADIGAEDVEGYRAWRKSHAFPPHSGSLLAELAVLVRVLRWAVAKGLIGQPAIRGVSLFGVPLWQGTRRVFVAHRGAL